MKTEDIIEGLNEHIETIRANQKLCVNGHLVLQKEIIPNSTFKAYKTYRYVLWFTIKGKSYKVISIEHTAKVLDGQEGNITRYMNVTLSTQIFNWVGTEEYKQVINGIFKGYSYETIKV